MTKESRARFRHEDVSAVPKGWRVRTVTHEGSGHRVRVAFPPGRREKGAGRLISILHPLTGQNPCTKPCSLKSTNPGELMVMSANPPRRTMNPDKYRVFALRRWARPGEAPLEHDFDSKDEAKRFAKSVDLEVYFRPHIQKVRLNPAELIVMGANPAGDHRADGKELYDEWIKKTGGNISFEAWQAMREESERSQKKQTASNPGAAELYQQFQGKPPKWETIADEPHMPKGDYAKLGDLVGLTIKPRDGGQVKVLQWFKGSYDLENYSERLLPLIDAPMVVSDSSGQIYFFQGNQDITEGLAAFGPQEAAHEAAHLYELGEARMIRYRTQKSHDDFELLDYVHKFGEESGNRPTVLFDALVNRLRLRGGSYRIEAPGIID